MRKVYNSARYEHNTLPGGMGVLPCLLCLSFKYDSQPSAQFSQGHKRKV